MADPTSDALSFWEPLRNAAVSCGAFPFAFRVKDLVRRRSEYDSPDIDFPSPFETFAYTDGGVFQNEPLGLAKNLVDEIDHHLDTESRFYLFIAPHAKKSTAHADFNAANADYRATAVQLFNAVYGQAAFQDWIQAEQVNELLATFNSRALELKDALESNRIQSAPLQDAADALLPLLFGVESAGAETGRQRLRRQFQKEFDDLARATSPHVGDTWIDSILVLETAAGLGERDEMVIYGITAKAEELAGSGLDAFVGFCAQEYRDHDYDVGRTKAREFLQNSSGLLGTEGNLPVLQNYVPKPVRPIDAKLDGLTLADVPRELRETIKGRLSDRANDLLKELNMPWAERGLVMTFFINKQIAKMLNL
ncbi:MAG TPA: hypothetical protein VNJ12_00410 [Candidatus Dormibacteraeota bacterium]|nr:hypothetical protein [Candidatus Dormibacteraeota bacterium]